MKWDYVKKFLYLGLLAGFVAALAVGLSKPERSQTHGATELSQFSSYQDLEDFVENRAAYPYYYTNGWRDVLTLGAIEDGEAAPSYASEYSKTNIQVEGVDEADIVKTDGEYIYLVLDNRLVIVKAYPPEEALILSEIELDGGIAGIFINEDRLALFENTAPVYATEQGQPGLRYITPQQQKISIKVYDISNREKPILKRDVAVDGYYFGSRMIDNYVYVIINGSVVDDDNEAVTPSIYTDGSVLEVPTSEIWHSNISDYSYMYATIMALNMKDDAQEPAHQTLLVGAASSLYVSMANIYVTFPGQAVDIVALPEQMAEVVYDAPKTAVHRIHIDGGVIEYDGSGEVPGRLLNQFSMDEHQGYFRVATTTDHFSREGGATLTNQVYVLDEALNVVGQLEDLAPGEQIHSARFMGNRCYLVTFKNIDPLFVIDLKDPYNPRVLGELKVTGYSDYLHPYDENHVIGIGKEAIAENDDFAWYQGVKISLFDVSDVNQPKEIGKYEIGDRGTDSPVLQDHKALLFDKAKNLLVIPVLVAEIDAAAYPYGIPASAYGEYVWQGAYVFNISLEEGLQFRGGITHCTDADFGQYGYYYSTDCFVERSLYIDDVLYTISDAKIKMNDLENLNEINEVVLQ
jgi:inhibitor of cysteine peptidase